MGGELDYRSTTRGVAGLAVLCLLAGCTTDSTGATAPPENDATIPETDAATETDGRAGINTFADFCRDYQRAWCEFQARCLPYHLHSDVDSCSQNTTAFWGCWSSMLPFIEQEIAAARLLFDPKTAESIVSARYVSSCAIGDQGTPLSPGVPAGGTCMFDWECETFCYSEVQCPGTCAIPLGGSCANNAPCDHGSVCDSNTTCVEIPVGEACHASPPHGCAKTSFCANKQGFICGEEEGPCACKPLAPLGAECRFDMCEAGLQCGRGTCASEAGEGAPCTYNIGFNNCESDLVCQVDVPDLFQYGWCGRPRAVGEACLHPTDCVTGFCAFPDNKAVQGLCAEFLAEGSSCVRNASSDVLEFGCGLGLYCLESGPAAPTGICTRCPREGDECTGSGRPVCFGGNLECAQDSTTGSRRCLRLRTEGEPCLEVLCAPDLYCDAGTCRKRRPMGSPCQAPEECLGGQCANNLCGPQGCNPALW